MIPIVAAVALIAAILVLFVMWLQGIKGQGVWNALAHVSWSTHLIVIALIILTLFLFHLPEISPQFKTQADLSFPLVILHVPIQYFIGLYLVRYSAESMRHLIILV